ncbi:unnamed protein product, partial [Adineta ricciae]
MPIKKIYDEEIFKAKFDQETLACVPLAEQIQPGLNQAQRKLTPVLPTTISFDIPDGYHNTTSGETFLISDKLFSRKKRMLAFGSPRQLQLLFESSMIFLDGTFLSTPPFFEQVFTIHGLKFDCELNSITVSMGMVWKPERMMSDFEVGLIPAISTEFPKSIHSCCFFRYQQSLYRRIQSLGLATAYSNDELVRNYRRKLTVLPLLPVDKVESSFYHLRTTVDSTVKNQLRDLFMYFDNYWINTIPVQMRNVHNCPYRTNNICEAGKRRASSNGANRVQQRIDNLM